MSTRIAIVLAGLVTAVPAQAAEMKADEARRFIIGKLFSYTAFYGTSGAGRVYADGSVIGTIRNGRGGVRFMAGDAGRHAESEGRRRVRQCARHAVRALSSAWTSQPVSFRGSLGAFGIAVLPFRLPRRSRRIGGDHGKAGPRAPAAGIPTASE